MQASGEHGPFQLRTTLVPESLYIIDGHAQIYRSYYAPFRPLTSPAGEPVKATYVFCSMLFNLIRERKPDYLAMVLDVSDRAVFRRDIYPEYKAHRDPPPEDLPPQADRIVEIVQRLGIPTLCKPGFEADDLMATIARRLADRDIEVYLVSKDKDLEQLITDRVFLFDPGKLLVTNRDTLLEQKGYTPEEAIDIQTLAGDNVDNIPGVSGVGPKTAAKLIARYGSAQGVLDHAEELTPKQRENVKAFATQMPITRQLVTLRDDVEFDFDIESARLGALAVDSVKPMFEELGFTRLTEQLATLAGTNATDDSRREPANPQAAARYELVDTEDKLATLARRLAGVTALAVDTETTKLNPVAAKLVGISLSWEEGTGYYVPVRAAVGDVVSMQAVHTHLKPVLENPNVRKVGQNIKYDIIVLRQAGIALAGVNFDTMIASFVLDPLRRSHGMDALAFDLLSHRMIPISDLIGKGKNQISIDEVDTNRVCEYAAEDAEVTWRLGEYLSKKLNAAPTKTQTLFTETEMPLVEVLAEMEHNGVTLDAGLLARMSDELGERIAELEKEIQQHAGYPFNVDSTKQLATVLFDEQGLSVVRKTKTGRSTDAETLQTLADTTNHPIPPLMLEYRELTKLKGTYLDTLPTMVCKRTGRLHAGFHQTGAVTGRLSSSDPNLQNIPVRTEIGRKIRGAFVACGDDWRLVVADYSQIELRVLAHFSHDEALVEAFRTGQDIHAAVAAQVNGVPLDAVTPEQRSAAKAVNFGIIYGQTAFGLSRSLGISRSNAQAFIDRYYERYPGIRSFFEQCVAGAKEKGYVETILGRRRPIDQLHSRNRQQVALGERLAVNTVIQGTAADLIKRAMIDIHNEIKKKQLATRMLIQVHDELVFEVRNEDIEAHTDMIREKMTTAIPLDVPILADIGAGKNWLEAK